MNKSQLYKGVIEVCILKLLSKEPDYGYNIISKLNKLEIKVNASTVYPILNRLSLKEYIDSRYELESSTVPRKIYTITQSGISKMQQSIRVWNNFVETINKII